MNGLDPFAFTWKDVKSGEDKVSQLVLKRDPGLCFTFDVNGRGEWAPYCSPFGGRRSVKLGTATWPSILGYVGQWAGELRQELDTPDPWEALPGIAKVAGANMSPETANNPFSVPEARQISKALEEIRELLLAQVKGSIEHARLVDREIKALRDASERMGRKDWFNLAIGTLINIATAVALSAEATKQVFHILKASLSGIIHFVPILAAAPQIAG